VDTPRHPDHDSGRPTQGYVSSGAPSLAGYRAADGRSASSVLCRCGCATVVLTPRLPGSRKPRTDLVREHLLPAFSANSALPATESLLAEVLAALTLPIVAGEATTVNGRLGGVTASLRFTTHCRAGGDGGNWAAHHWSMRICAHDRRLFWSWRLSPLRDSRVWQLVPGSPL
jgi:hypothetical protein